MAGYIFTLDSIESLKNIIESGVYSTNLKLPTKNIWNIQHEGTFADFLSMSEGDYVYFFIKRKIYGVGRLININSDCKHLNFPGADIPIVGDFEILQESMILNNAPENLKNRFICTFTGAPFFFKKGIDMDEVLSSNPSAFKMLRVLWKLSFIKIDDVENEALFNIILKSNEKELPEVEDKNVFTVNNLVHRRLQELHNEEYRASAKNILHLAADGEMIKHEMAIEAGIIDYIKSHSNGIFGKWDYLSHQVVASPFKPVDYMDKMDVFGYRFIPGYTTISKFLVVEIKKGTAGSDVIHQVMKYIDWVNQEYTYGDYNMIEAFIVAKEFPREVIQLKEEIAHRTFTKGRRPPVSEMWNNLRLISYEYNPDLKTLEFKEST